MNHASKVYITKSPYIISMIQTIYYNEVYNLNRVYPKWSKYRGEPIVVIEDLDYHKRWLKYLDNWVTRTVFHKRKYFYMNRITIIKVTNPEIYYCPKMEQFIHNYNVVFLDMEFLKQRYLNNPNHIDLGDNHLFYIMYELERYIRLPIISI